MPAAGRSAVFLFALLRLPSGFGAGSPQVLGDFNTRGMHDHDTGMRVATVFALTLPPTNNALAGVYLEDQFPLKGTCCEVLC